jgi:hypothetical protein
MVFFYYVFWAWTDYYKKNSTILSGGTLTGTTLFKVKIKTMFFKELCHEISPIFGSHPKSSSFIEIVIKKLPVRITSERNILK